MPATATAEVRSTTAAVGRSAATMGRPATTAPSATTTTAAAFWCGISRKRQRGSEDNERNTHCEL
jgi:hypothetical protein